MRLTNPVDQLMSESFTDSLGSLIDKMTSFKQGEALVGESIILPSIVQIEPCSIAPSSNVPILGTMEK